MPILQQAIVGTIGAAALFTAYFLPSIIASRRGHRQAGAITVLNLLLGWTLLGWVIALVWSCSYVAPARA